VQVVLVDTGQKLLEGNLRFRDGSHDELSVHDPDLNDGFVRQASLLRKRFRYPQGETVPPFPDADSYGCASPGYLQRVHIGVCGTRRDVADRIRFFRAGAEGIVQATAHRGWMRNGNFPLRSTAGQRNELAFSFTAFAPQFPRITAKKKGQGRCSPCPKEILFCDELRPSAFASSGRRGRARPM
jgi:hypothetical protein